MRTADNIKDKLSRLNALEKIIVANTVLFVIMRFLEVHWHWLELPSYIGDVVRKPWSLVTYAFLHYSFSHLFFNMLWLYVIGKMFLNHFGPKMALNIYFLGAVSGGVLFVLCYHLLPTAAIGASNLIGASAAVRALLIFMCAYMPSQEARFFTIGLKLSYIGMAIVFLDVMGLFAPNAGGYLAHLGGALLGYLYAKQLIRGRDVGKWFEKTMDATVSAITCITRFKRQSLKTVYKRRTKAGRYEKADFNAFNQQKKIDVILDKISKSGYDSLTAEEKALLFRMRK